MGLILVGQTELWEKLQLQVYAAIRQRINVQSVLNHYDRSRTGAYIRRQLNYAGCTQEIFTGTAVDAVYHIPIHLWHRKGHRQGVYQPSLYLSDMRRRTTSQIGSCIDCKLG